jgi:hypothetical protein
MAIRRRPILRAAAVGGMGYKVGKTASKQAGPQAETSTPPPNASPQPQTQAPAAAPGAPASQTERIKALAELKTLLDSGAVTQAEFELAKKGLLEGG